MEELNWALTPFPNGNTYTSISAEKRLKANTDETDWGMKAVGTVKSNWSAVLGERLVEWVLTLLGEEPTRPPAHEGYKVDFEGKSALYEVKTRNWTTTGSAGEKVLGCLYKYSDLPSKFKKPLKIVCVAYQEHELTHGTTRVFGSGISRNKRSILRFMRNLDIEFVKFSDLAKKALDKGLVVPSNNRLRDLTPRPTPAVVKPLLKWVGGKSKLLDTLMVHFPTTIHNYHEPFVGGGSVLLEVLRRVQSGEITITGKVHAYDLNPVLIEFYCTVRDRPEELVDALTRHATVYSGLPVIQSDKKYDTSTTPLTPEECLSQQQYYYYIRNTYNESRNSPSSSPVELVAMFMFLNKTCFRGLYREGPRGFNVPFGNYKRPCFDLERIAYVSTLLEEVTFTHQHFRDTLRSIKGDQDYVYLDPPYVPTTPTSFVKYTLDGFTQQDHEFLFDCIDKLPRKGVVMSNSSSTLVSDRFTRERGYRIYKTPVTRSINSRNPGSRDEEVIVVKV